MEFLAYLVISLTQLTPFGLAQTNVALPFPTQEACAKYLELAQSEVMSASNLQVVQSSVTCVDAKELLGEPEEAKPDPKKQI